MDWWGWVLFGLFLLIGELITPGILIGLFFSLGAFFVGLLTYYKLITTAWIQWFSFAFFSLTCFIISLLFKKSNRNSKDFDRHSLIDEQVKILKLIEPGETGHVNIRGVSWKALNGDSEQLPEDTYAQIKDINGITLILKKITILNKKVSL